MILFRIRQSGDIHRYRPRHSYVHFRQKLFLSLNAAVPNFVTSVYILLEVELTATFIPLEFTNDNCKLIFISSRQEGNNTFFMKGGIQCKRC